jgi:hypothetical protein
MVEIYYSLGFLHCFWIELSITVHNQSDIKKYNKNFHSLEYRAGI